MTLSWLKRKKYNKIYRIKSFFSLFTVGICDISVLSFEAKSSISFCRERFPFCCCSFLMLLSHPPSGSRCCCCLCWWWFARLKHVFEQNHLSLFDRPHQHLNHRTRLLWPCLLFFYHRPTYLPLRVLTSVYLQNLTRPLRPNRWKKIREALAISFLLGSDVCFNR